MSKSLGNVIDPMHVIYGASIDQLKAPILSSQLNETEKQR
jgi:valyl-tRNA synthetase